jgi:hypothetical protein
MIDFKKLLGEGAKEMLQSAALGGIKELGKIMLERDEYKRRLDIIRACAADVNTLTISKHTLIEVCEGRPLQ